MGLRQQPGFSAHTMREETTMPDTVVLYTRLEQMSALDYADVGDRVWDRDGDEWTKDPDGDWTGPTPVRIATSTGMTAYGPLRVPARLADHVKVSKDSALARLEGRVQVLEAAVATLMEGR